MNRLWIRLVFAFLGLFVLIGIISYLGGRFPNNVVLFGFSSFQWCVGIIVAVYLLAVLWGLIRFSKKTDIKCPYCRKSLQSGFLVSTAITTGKCSHCGKRVIEELPLY